MAKFKQMSGREAEAYARSAHRKEQFKSAKRGKGPAPAYSEAGGCLLALLAFPWVMLARWRRSA